MHKKNIGRVCSQRHALVKKQKVGEKGKGKGQTLLCGQLGGKASGGPQVSILVLSSALAGSPCNIIISPCI